jgi:hypothetical protein
MYLSRVVSSITGSLRISFPSLHGDLIEEDLSISDSALTVQRGSLPSHDVPSRLAPHLPRRPSPPP